MSPHGQAQILKETDDEYEKFKAIIFKAMGKMPVRITRIIFKKVGIKFLNKKLFIEDKVILWSFCCFETVPGNNVSKKGFFRFSACCLMFISSWPIDCRFFNFSPDTKN